MPSIDFKEIPSANTGSGDQDSFEMFASEFLELTGYRITSGPDRGADQGRDLVAEETRFGIGGTTTIRWLVSCKHHAHSGKAVGVDDELNILERVSAHNCTGFIGFYSTIASAGLTTRLEALRKSANLDFNLFNRTRIEGPLTYGPPFDRLFKRYFPLSFLGWAESDFNISLALERIGLPQPIAYAYPGQEDKPLTPVEAQKLYPTGNRYFYDVLMPCGNAMILCNNVLGITKLIIEGKWVDPPADYMDKRAIRMQQEMEALRMHEQHDPPSNS